MNGRHCYISPITLQTAMLILPSANAHWSKLLVPNSLTEQNSTVVSFVNNLLDGELTEASENAPITAQHSWPNLNSLKGNYVDKNFANFGTHWKKLQHWYFCFKKFNRLRKQI